MNPFDPKAALLAKHAQHVVLIHFPIALFLTGVAFDFAARCTRKAALEAAARLNILAAAGTVLPTLATGILAWQWQLEGQKLKGLLLLHLALGCTSALLICLVPGSICGGEKQRVPRFRFTACPWNSWPPWSLRLPLTSGAF